MIWSIVIGILVTILILFSYYFAFKLGVSWVFMSMKRKFGIDERRLAELIAEEMDRTGREIF